MQVWGKSFRHSIIPIPLPSVLPQNVKDVKQQYDRKLRTIEKQTRPKRAQFSSVLQIRTRIWIVWSGSAFCNRNAVSNPAGEKKFASKNAVSWSQGFLMEVKEYYFKKFFVKNCKICRQLCRRILSNFLPKSDQWSKSQIFIPASKFQDQNFLKDLKRKCRVLYSVFLIRIRIRIHLFHMFLGLPDPDPLVRGMDPDPAPDPSIIKQK
jgi:hypothetical protein